MSVYLGSAARQKVKLTGLAIAFALLILCLNSSTSYAGTITLTLSTRASVSGQVVDIEFNLANSGTGAANDVRVSATLQEQSGVLAIADDLSSGARAQGVLQFELKENSRGTFPLFIEIVYRDESGAEFSTASLASVRTEGAAPSNLSLAVTRGYNEKWGVVQVHVESKDPSLRSVFVTCQCPSDLSVEPKSCTVPLVLGKGVAEFKLVNQRALEGSRYAVLFAAEFERDGVHYAADAGASIPVSAVVAREAESGTASILNKSLIHSFSGWTLVTVFAGLVVILASVASSVSKRARGGMRLVFDEKAWGQIPLDLIAIMTVEWFLLSRLSPEHLVTSTVSAGGDMASHYYTVDYMRHVLLPGGQLSGWTMGNYAGFPMLQMYFPLSFLLMCGLDVFMSLQIAFKWVTLLGSCFLPVAAYLMLRLMRVPFPGPAIGATCVLPFLFNSENSMWGGNLLSTLAGEFSYSLSMALSLILLGSLYRGVLTNRRVILNAFLVFLVGFSHGYTLLFVEAMSVFFLFVPNGFLRRITYLGKVYLLGFCFLGFWIVPLLAFTDYTTPYHFVWTIQSFKEIIPVILLPVVVAGAAGGIALFVWGVLAFKKGGAHALSVLAFLCFGVVVVGVMFVVAPELGVVNIRFVPYAQLMLCLVAAVSLGWMGKLLGRVGLGWVILILAVPAMMMWTSARVVDVSEWSRWNYSGFEGKRAWSKFQEINNALRGTFEDPRVMFEHSSRHNNFGSTRAFESLPFFAGRATLEGVYMQASISAPFIFYIQSEISKEKSCPFPQYTYTSMNYPAARRRLEMFNVRDLILRSPEAKRAARSAPDYRHSATFHDYELWQLTVGNGKYVVPLEYEPVLFPADNWKVDSHDWFARDNLLDTHLVFMNDPSPLDKQRFKAQAKSLGTLPLVPIDTSGCRVVESIANDEINIETNWIGKPLLIKVSYHPNWRVEGADKIYLVSPSFMLIYPDSAKVRLYYGTTWPGRLGTVLTAIGIVVLLLNVRLPRKKTTAWSMIALRLGIPEDLVFKLRRSPSVKASWVLLVVTLISVGLVLSVLCYGIYTHEPHRMFKKAIMLKDASRYAEARLAFREVMQSLPSAPLAHDSAYYVAITYFLQQEDEMAIKSFEFLVERFPDSRWVPEAEYHIGYSLFRCGKEHLGIEKMHEVIRCFPGSQWAIYAKERLREHHALEEGGKKMEL